MSRNEIKNVDRMQCIGIMVTAVIAFITLVIPVTFGTAGTALAYKFFPFEDKTEFMKTMFTANFQGLAATIGDESLAASLGNLTNFATALFYGILAFDFIMAFVIAIFGLQFLRKICKFISFFLGLAGIGIAVLHLLSIGGFALSIINGIISPENIMSALEVCGLLYSLGMIVFGFIIGFKQFGWFSKYYDDREPKAPKTPTAIITK